MSKKKNILYIGEVPVEPKPGGALLLYRCFDYLELDLDKIYVNLEIERKAKTQYYNHLFSRLNKTRFSAFYANLNFKVLWVFLFFRLVFKLKSYSKVFTVSHGVTYKVVFNICKIWKKDLIIFHHDLYSKTFNTGKNSSDQIEQWFVKSLRNDFVTNLYVSPYMKTLYNVKGDLLYPTRTKHIRENKAPKKDGSSHDMYYAGSVHSKSNYLALLNVANYLAQLGGRLHIYSNVTKESFRNRFDNLPDNILFNGFVEQDKLREILYKNADSMLLVQNFEASEQTAQMVNFPSKLADYTLVGVPIIIVAPKYASSAQWFLALNKKIGVLIDSSEAKDLKIGLDEFFVHEEKHSTFGRNAQKIGKEYFSIESYDFNLKKLLR